MPPPLIPLYSWEDGVLLFFYMLKIFSVKLTSPTVAVMDPGLHGLDSSHMKLKKMFIVSSPVVPASRLHFKKCFSENAVIINVILKNATKFLYFFFSFFTMAFFYYVFWVKSFYQYVLNLGDRLSMFCTFSKSTFVKRYHHILSLDLISSLLYQNCL